MDHLRMQSWDPWNAEKCIMLNRADSRADVYNDCALYVFLISRSTSKSVFVFRRLVPTHVPQVVSAERDWELKP